MTRHLLSRDTTSQSPDELCYFVHWKGYDKDEDSWTTEENAECVYILSPVLHSFAYRDL